MALYEVRADRLEAVKGTSFAAQKLQERADLQRLLQDQIEVIVPDAMVLAEEFGDWEDSRRRIDLLCLDKEARLVVVELKRGEDGGHMDLQALRYAAMVSALTFERAVQAYEDYRRKRGDEQVDGRSALLDFLDLSEPDEETFGSEVRIVLVAMDFNVEITSTVLWLNDRGLDIRCVQLRPYEFEGRLLADVDQVLPLREAEEYQVRLREKGKQKRRSREGKRDYTKYDVILDGVRHERQAKRRAVLLVVRHLCGRGVTPEHVVAAVPWRAKNLWFSVPGVLGGDGAGFEEAALAEAEATGRAFDARRWYCGDDELIVSGGRTWAISNQWGGRAGEAMGEMVKRLGDGSVVVEVSGS